MAGEILCKFSCFDIWRRGKGIHLRYIRNPLASNAVAPHSSSSLVVMEIVMGNVDSDLQTLSSLGHHIIESSENTRDVHEVEINVCSEQVISPK